VSTKDDDFTEHLFTATMHKYLLIFTDKGRLFWKRVHELPEGSRIAKGRPVQNLINIEGDDKVRAVVNIKTLDDPDYINNNYIVMCTKQGTIKKTRLEAFSRPRQNGIIAITIDEEDRLLSVCLTNGDNDIVVASRSGKAVRFHETRVRPMGRQAAGVKAITLDDENPDDQVVGMVCISSPEAQLLVVSEKGYGKRSDVHEYRVTNRGAKGVGTLKVTEKVGHLVAILDVANSDDLMIINRSGIAIRTPVEDVRVIGRNTQGVKLIRLNDNDSISSVTKITREEEVETIFGIVAEGEVAEGSGLISDETVTDSPVAE
ncbi:MAG: DNA gyrase subunit A, partial [Rudanella sp.]|nr:DNA gyrase subunit A [Rudanella sp.]